MFCLHSKLFSKPFTPAQALVGVKSEENLIAHLFTLVSVGCRYILIVTCPPSLPILKFAFHLYHFSSQTTRAQQQFSLELEDMQT